MATERVMKTGAGEDGRTEESRSRRAALLEHYKKQSESGREQEKKEEEEPLVEEPVQGWAAWSRSILGSAYGEAAVNNPVDPDLSLAELLETNESAINAMKSRVSSDPLYDQTRHDSLWLLRFLMSHDGHAEKAAAAFLRAMAIRKQEHLDEIGDIASSRHHSEWPVRDVFSQIMPSIGLSPYAGPH